MTVYRKDGRPLVTEFEVKPEDFIEYFGRISAEELADAGVACGGGLRGDRYEAWMDDI